MVVWRLDVQGITSLARPPSKHHTLQYPVKSKQAKPGIEEGSISEITNQKRKKERRADKATPK